MVNILYFFPSGYLQLLPQWLEQEWWINHKHAKPSEAKSPDEVSGVHEFDGQTKWGEEQAGGSDEGCWGMSGEICHCTSWGHRIRASVEKEATHNKPNLVILWEVNSNQVQAKLRPPETFWPGIGHLHDHGQPELPAHGEPSNEEVSSELNIHN